MDIETRERKLIADIRKRVQDLLKALKDLEVLDKKEKRERVLKKLEKEEIREVQDLLRALNDASIVLADLFAYFDLLVMEIKQIGDPLFARRLERVLLLDIDKIRRRIESVINRMERYGIKLARR